MITSEKKNFERKFFKNLRNKSSAFDMRNVEINVKIYLDSIFKIDLKKKYIGMIKRTNSQIRKLRGTTIMTKQDSKIVKSYMPYNK